MMKLIYWLADRIPLVFAFGLVLLAAITGDWHSAQFYITMAVMFIMLRELSVLRDLLKKQEARIHGDD